MSLEMLEIDLRVSHLKQKFFESCLKKEMQKALRLEAENERLRCELMSLRPHQSFETDSKIVQLTANDFASSSSSF